VEDEAVIASALRHSIGVELVDVSAILPSLIISPGLRRWRVNTGLDGSGLHTWEEATAEQVEEWRLSRSLFPPTDAESAIFALHRCCRIMPHAQDTGGFFVALLRKSEGARVDVDPCAAALLHSPSVPAAVPATVPAAVPSHEEAEATPPAGDLPDESVDLNAADLNASDPNAGQLQTPAALDGCAGDARPGPRID
jgi:hypothetical protein